jgi:hypothetical protein
MGQAAGRGHHPHHGNQEDQRRRGARVADHHAGGEEQVERGRDLRDTRHDDTEQPELTMSQRSLGLRGGGHG